MTAGSQNVIPSKLSLTLGVVAAFLLCIPGQLAWGTSVREVGFEEMLTQCELVFEGRVLDIETRKPSGNRHVRTYVTFQVLDVLKGHDPGETLELSFLGGTWQGKTLMVHDLNLPQAGEIGIYFVESLAREQVHPLYGWSQGHFLVVPDADGIDRVTTESRRPVTGLRSGYVGLSAVVSEGIARGLELSDVQRPSDAMTVEEFKRDLAEILNVQR